MSRRAKPDIARAQRRGLLMFAAAAALLLAAAVGTASLRGDPADAIGGPFELRDVAGGRVTDQTYRGHWMLVYFGYSSCPDACPTVLADIAETLDRLGPDGDRLRPLFITVDPTRDTPALLASYVAAFDRRIAALTGTTQQVATALKRYHLDSQPHRPATDGSYGIDHGSVVFLMNPAGKYVAHFGPEIDVDGMTATVRGMLAQG
jgi:protein SCO1/2